MSKQYENEVAKEMHRETGNAVRVYTAGYSGNNAFPQPDIHVATENMNHDLELKGPIAKDTVVVEDEDLEQLVACQNGYTAVYLVVKFPHREPLVIRYYGALSGSSAADDGLGEWAEKSIPERFEALAPDCFNPRTSTANKSGTTRLYLDKPETDEWTSTRAGRDDVTTIIEELGIQGAVTMTM